MNNEMRILHIDIETAPHNVYAWGLWKQDISIKNIVESGYTLCFAAKWQGEKKVEFYSTHEHGFDYMIEKAWELLDEADVVVHYNGTKFDIPTLNREFLLHELNPPSPYHQIDLLKTVRSKFRFASNKLDYVAQQLGLGGKTQHKGMELWHECMAGDNKAWKTMEKYNKQDVKLTEKLYGKLLPWIENHPNHALYVDNGVDRPTCPNCGGHHLQSRGTYTTKTQRYQRFCCSDCGTWTRSRHTEVGKEERQNILVGTRV